MVGLKVIGVYKIEFNNGTNQIRNLILQDDYNDIIKPANEEIHELEKKGNNKEAKTIKNNLKSMFGEQYFTDKSPIFESQINNGIIVLPESQGGNKYSCKLHLLCPYCKNFTQKNIEEFHKKLIGVFCMGVPRKFLTFDKNNDKETELDNWAKKYLKNK